jgi:hypothetical protein
MCLSEEENHLLDEIRDANSLTEDELNLLETYGGFKSIEMRKPENKELPPALYNGLKDILKKYDAGGIA